MSMFVTVRASDGQVRDFEIHTGEPVLRFPDGKTEVIEVQADGDELDYIVENFQAIPLAWNVKKNIENSGVNRKLLNRVQRWFGDHAKFIYHNLKW